MKSLRHAVTAIAVVAIGLWGVAPAAAVPITDFVNPTDTLIAYGSTPSPCPSGFVCTTSALTFVHDITDDGFVPGTDTITSATITVHLTDTGGSETYMFTLGASQTFTNVNVPGGNGSSDPVILSLPSLADLEADGKIAVTVESLQPSAGQTGDFLFADSLLTADVTHRETEVPGPTSQVPGPASWLLVAAGVAAIWIPRSAKMPPAEGR